MHFLLCAAPCIVALLAFVLQYQLRASNTGRSDIIRNEVERILDTRSLDYVYISASCRDVVSASTSLRSIWEQNIHSNLDFNLTSVLVWSSEAKSSDMNDCNELGETETVIGTETRNIPGRVVCKHSNSPEWDLVRRRNEVLSYVAEHSTSSQREKSAIVFLDECERFASTNSLNLLLESLLNSDIPSDKSILTGVGTRTCWIRPSTLFRQENGITAEAHRTPWDAFEFARKAAQLIEMRNTSAVIDMCNSFEEERTSMIGWVDCQSMEMDLDLGTTSYTSLEDARNELWVRAAFSYVRGTDIAFPAFTAEVEGDASDSHVCDKWHPTGPSLMRGLVDTSHLNLARIKRLWHPAVSVVIPFYNIRRNEWFEEALNSLYAQTFADFHVTLVDDGSDLAAKDILLKTLGARGPDGLFWYKPGGQSDVASRDVPVRLVTHRWNLGLSEARNTGVFFSNSEYVVFLDPDDVLEDGALEKLAIAARQRISSDAGTELLPIVKPRRASFQTAFVYPGVVHFGSQRDVVYMDYSAQRLRRENFIPATIAISKRVYTQVGGMCSREAVRFFEDWDFWIRLAVFGYTGSLLREPLFRYRRHENGNSAILKHNSSSADWVSELQKNNPTFWGDMEIEALREVVQNRWAELREQMNVVQDDTLACYQPFNRGDRYKTRWEDSTATEIGRMTSKNDVPVNTVLPLLFMNSLDSIYRFNPIHISKARPFSVLYVLPWMSIGGADLYDLQVLKLIKEMYPASYITLVTCRHRDVHPWEGLFGKESDEIWHLQTMTNNSHHQESTLDYLAISRRVSLMIVSRAAIAYEALERWHRSENTSLSNVRTLDILHMPSYNLTCDWEWRSGRVAWALHARVAVSKHLKSYLLEVVRAGHTALCKPITVNESIVGRAFASPLEEQHKIHVIPPPFVPAQGRKLSPSNTSDLVRSGPIVLFVGRLDEQKDPMLWLDVGSFILKNASHSQPRLVIAGGGPMEREVMERLYGLNEAQTTVYGEEPSDFHRYVDLLGPQSRENLTRIFTRGDSVLLSTSRNEGVPLVLIDAAANGVPVVTLQCGAIEEIFDRLPTPTFVPETPRTHAVKRHALGSIVALNCIALAGMNSGDRHRVVETLAKEVMWWLSKLKERGTAHFLKEKRSSILNVRTTFGVDRFNREWRELLAELFK